MKVDNPGRFSHVLETEVNNQVDTVSTPAVQ